MTINEANNFFESLKIETTNKSEIRIYEKFLHILTGLKSKELSQDELRSIESELDRLDLESKQENRTKYFEKSLMKFEKYLKDTFSLTSKWYYTKIGIGLGSSFGLLFGIVFLPGLERSMGIALGLGVGMLIGLIIGRSIDARAIREGKVL